MSYTKPKDLRNIKAPESGVVKIGGEEITVASTLDVMRLANWQGLRDIKELDLVHFVINDRQLETILRSPYLADDTIIKLQPNSF